MRKLNPGLGLLMLTVVALPANGQQYHQDYGGSRVVYQNQTGLFHSDSSYISPGALSQSAQGKSAGMTTNGLPSTTWGGYIRSPGDELYNGANGAMRNGNGSVVYADEIMRMKMLQQQQYMQRRYMYQQRLQQQMMNRQQGNFYVPGSNGGAASYGGDGSAAGYGSYSGR